MAQGGSGGTATTDDVKTAQAVAQQQHLSIALDALQTRHEAEVYRVQDVVSEQKQVMEDLASEIAQLKNQLLDDGKKHREHWEEVERGLARFGSQDHIYNVKTTDNDNIDEEDEAIENDMENSDELMENDEENPDDLSDKDTEILNIPFKRNNDKNSKTLEDNLEDMKSLQDEDGDEIIVEPHLEEKEDNIEDIKETENNNENSEEDIVLLKVKKLSPEEDNDNNESKDNVENTRAPNEEENESLIPEDSTENNDEYVINKDDPDDSMGPVSNMEEDMNSKNKLNGGSEAENETHEEKSSIGGHHETEEDVGNTNCESKVECLSCESLLILVGALGEALDDIEKDVGRQSHRMDHLMKIYTAPVTIQRVLSYWPLPDQRHSQPAVSVMS
ncbi:unnamed protein product [Meganyctiphanes norvegica]|uniref:Uncharacterized protein n=1 Tax=Meganyctiphanes norvegica TaxID=48144 RepID=A0AAV2QLW0_MEGNR